MTLTDRDAPWQLIVSATRCSACGGCGQAAGSRGWQGALGFLVGLVGWVERQRNPPWASPRPAKVMGFAFARPILQPFGALTIRQSFQRFMVNALLRLGP